ncbi:MAG: hypothetical protein Q4A79_00170 [Candidatus Saccharibacteria bacterium]|nr:hypothetical protein [Candidatus Saccharibacteria bacterium]
MDATFLEKIKSDFPNLKFRVGKKFAFRPPRTIIIGPEEPNDSLLLLHELGHALLNHSDFNIDIDRLKMEREAWTKAKELSALYEEVIFDEGLMERELDTYRDWLYRKSRCPKCGLTRFQGRNRRYCCPKCDASEF